MNNTQIKAYVYLILSMVYIVPNGLLFGSFSAIHNHIFAVLVAIIYLVPKIKNRSLEKKTLLIWVCVIIIAIYTGKYGFIDMIIIPILNDLIRNKEHIKSFLLKSQIVYICLFFSIFYSILYRYLGVSGRGEGIIGSGIVFTAIGEINLSGLSLFCLATIILKRNKIIGYGVFILGMLTVSRSYLLAVACLFICNLKISKKFITKFMDKMNYRNLTIISSIVLFILGLICIDLYSSSRLIEYSNSVGFERLILLNDYSNYFRFLAIYLVVMIIIKNPYYLLLGFSDAEYLINGHSICNSLGVPFSGIGPHNIFYSHLKIYGIAVFFEVNLISKYLKQIVTVNNFGIYIGVFLYGVFLGTGLYNYWLFLTALVLIHTE